MSSHDERKTAAVAAINERFGTSRDPRERHALHGLFVVLTERDVAAVCINDDIANVKAHEFCREFKISVMLVEPTLRGKTAAGIDVGKVAEFIESTTWDVDLEEEVTVWVPTDKQWALYALAEDGELVNECCVKGYRTRDGSFDVYYQQR